MVELKKVLCRGVIALLLVVCAGCAAKEQGQVKEQQKQETDGFQYISHRGGCDSFPENTADALTYALDRGFHGVELDVWESDSGELLVFHDATLSRMCGSEKYIWEINTENRGQYPILYESDKNGEMCMPIPTLGEVLDVLKDRQCPIYLHIKIDKDAGHHFSQEAANQVVALLKERNLTENAIIFSTYQDTVMRLFLNQGLHLGYITGQTERAVLDDKIAWCVENHVETLILYKMDGIKLEENGADLVKACHDNGLSVGVYKVKNKEDEQILIETGADFSISKKAFFE